LPSASTGQAPEEPPAAQESEQAAPQAERRSKSQPRSRRHDHNVPVAKAAAPDALSDDQFDPQTGKISWPKTLQGQAFAPARSEWEKLAVEARLASADAVRCRNDKIRDLTEDIRRLLKEQVKKIPSREYIPAKKFIIALADELRSQSE
jgi:hypothetical protein